MWLLLTLAAETPQKNILGGRLLVANTHVLITVTKDGFALRITGTLGRGKDYGKNKWVNNDNFIYV